MKFSKKMEIILYETTLPEVLSDKKFLSSRTSTFVVYFALQLKKQQPQIKNKDVDIRR